MRRFDKEVKDPEELKEIIRKATVLRVAMVDEPYPYLVPVNFGYRNGAFFFHSALEGRKIELLRRNNRVGFEVEANADVVTANTPCKWSTSYASIIGTGLAFFIDDPQEKWEGLETVFRHYTSAPFEIPLSAIEGIAVVRIEVTAMTGKVSKRPATKAGDVPVGSPL